MRHENRSGVLLVPKTGIRDKEGPKTDYAPPHDPDRAHKLAAVTTTSAARI